MSDTQQGNKRPLDATASNPPAKSKRIKSPPPVYFGDSDEDEVKDWAIPDFAKSEGTKSETLQQRFAREDKEKAEEKKRMEQEEAKIRKRWGGS